MALKFQPPQNLDTTSPNEAFNKGLGNTLSNLPLLYQQMKQQHAQSLMENEKLGFLRQQVKSQYGTGAPAPMAQGPVDASGVGPVTPAESPTDLMGRIGTEGVKAQADLYKATKPEPRTFMFDPATKTAYDETGNEATEIPPGSKMLMMPQPKVSEEDKATAKNNAKLKAEKPKALGSVKSTLQGYDSIIAEANAIKNDPDLGKATGFFMGRVTAPGGATRVASRLDTLKSKTVISAIGSLKELSKNGATGFGALSDTEGKRLEDSVQALERKVDTKDFKAAIDRFIREIQDKRDLIKETYLSTYGGSEDELNTNTYKPSVTAQATHRFNPATGKVEPIQ